MINGTTLLFVKKLAFDIICHMKYFKQVPLKNLQYTEIIGELPNKPITEIVATQKDNHLYQPI